MNGKTGRTAIAVLLLVLLAAVVLWPLARPGLVRTDDGNWMVIRLTAFYQSLREGQFPVRFLGRLNYHYGYPVANFLYPGYLYLGSLLRLAGLSFPGTVETITALSVVLTAVALFFWLKREFGNVAAWIGASSYVLSPYLAYDVFKRGSVGEVLAGAAGAGILALSETGAVWPIAPLFALLILSHNTTAVLLAPVIVAYTLVVRKRYWLILHYAVGTLMASFFWFPALYERRFVVFDATSVSDPKSYFTDTALIGVWYAGAVLSVCALVAEKTGRKVRQTSYFLFVGLVAAWLTTSSSILVWKLPLVAMAVQFPFRFMSVLWLVLPYLIARSVSSRRFAVSAVLAGIALIPMAAYSLPLSWGSSSAVEPEGFYTTNEATTTTRDEYMPRWVRLKPSSHAETPAVFFQGRGTIVPVKATTQILDLKLTAADDSILQVNTVFYPGWGATLDGKPVEISFGNEYGLMRIPIPKGEHRLYMAFRETYVRFLMLVISAAALAVWVVVAVLVPLVTAVIHRKT
jgi:hypothetical protein